MRSMIAQKVDLERVGRLQPEEKVAITIDITEAMVRMCIEGIKAQNSDITEEELMEQLRQRLQWAKRLQRRGGHVK